MWLSLRPDAHDFGDHATYKLGHTGAYFAMMFWFAQVYPRGRVRNRLALGFCLLGVVLECLQGLTDTRSFELEDFFFNSSGVLIGWTLARTALDRSLAWFERLCGLQRG